MSSSWWTLEIRGPKKERWTAQSYCGCLFFIGALAVRHNMKFPLFRGSTNQPDSRGERRGSWNILQSWGGLRRFPRSNWSGPVLGLYQIIFSYEPPFYWQKEGRTSFLPCLLWETALSVIQHFITLPWPRKSWDLFIGPSFRIHVILLQKISYFLKCRPFHLKLFIFWVLGFSSVPGFFPSLETQKTVYIFLGRYKYQCNHRSLSVWQAHIQRKAEFLSFTINRFLEFHFGFSVTRHWNCHNYLTTQTSKCFSFYWTFFLTK